MPNTITHNKFIFIMTSDPPILSLIFFYWPAIFIQNWAFLAKKCMYNAMGKILKFTIVHFWYHIWFLHIISP